MGEPTGNGVRDSFRTWGPYYDAATAQPFEGYNWRTDAAVLVDEIALQWYQSHEHAADSPTDYHIIYFDDVVVATDYIGCRYEGDPPAGGAGGTGGAASVGGAAAGGGSAGGSAGGTASGAPANGASDDDGGCGCRATGRDSGPSTGLGMMASVLALGALSRRQRRQRD